MIKKTKLELLLILLKQYNISVFKDAEYEIHLREVAPSNIPALKEEEQTKVKKPIAIWDDPDFNSHLPFRTKLRGENNE